MISSEKTDKFLSSKPIIDINRVKYLLRDLSEYVAKADKIECNFIAKNERTNKVVSLEDILEGKDVSPKLTGNVNIELKMKLKMDVNKIIDIEVYYD